MHPKFTDVNYTLKFGREKIAWKFLVIGLLCLAFGIYGVSYDDSSNRKLMAWVALVLGFGLSGYGLHHSFNAGKPLAMLSPAGVELHIEWVKTFLIPWHEVRSVEKIDVSVPARMGSTTFKDVTAVVVTKRFYDRVIHVSNPLLRGPGWNNAFIDNGDTVQVALNHAVLPASAEEIYAAVDARWRAFRDRKPAHAKSAAA